MRQSLSKFILLAALLLGCIDVRAQEALPEYRIKAAFLYHFAEFVSWPTNAFVETNSPYVIGVLGKDPFGQNLEDTLNGHSLNNHPFVVRRISNVAQARGCQILFISRSETRRLDDIIADLKDQPILTVSEIDGFINRGGMVQFLNTGDKVRFAINNTVARSSGLRISSQLLSLAVSNK